MIEGENHVYQAFLGTLMTWGLTAASGGAAVASSEIQLKTESVHRDDDLEEGGDGGEDVFDEPSNDDYYEGGAGGNDSLGGFEGGDDSGAGPSDLGKDPYKFLSQVEGSKKVWCNLCQRELSNALNGASHVQDMHLEKDYEFQCPECSSKLGTRGSIVGHMKIKHKQNISRRACDPFKTPKVRVDELDRSFASVSETE